jgi:hypothetical protein
VPFAKCFVAKPDYILFASEYRKRITRRGIHNHQLDRIGPDIYRRKFQGPAFSSFSEVGDDLVFCVGSRAVFVFTADCVVTSPGEVGSSITFATERRRSAATLRTDRDAFIT